MKINVTENKVSIKEEQILNENEYNIHKIQFDFSSEYTDDLVKVALFSMDNHTYKKIISNNECDIPPEVLTQRGYSILGVYAYKTEQASLVLRYSPSPTKISVYDGSYKAEAENSEPITPSEIEQYQQILQNSLQQFQNQYNALVEETEGDIQAIEDELQRKVDEGYFDGEDGFSPIAKVIQKSNGATIEIEDKNGKTTADVLNGEDGYTPVRGVDYWTEEDKQEVKEEATQQIEGKIEEYNENAAEKLNQYNQNSVQKINDYNTNAEQKMSAYNTNATEKFNDYNSNAEQKETNYNTNASQKVESFNTNASSKLSEYNSNAETKKSAYDENATQKTNSFNTNATNKLTEYNTNHTEKMSAYNNNSTEKLNAFNENATQKTEDFDEHTEEIQDNIEILQRTDNQILSRFNKDEEVSGQDITLTGTTEIKFAKPPLPMGNSEQESTTGKNLASDVYSEYSLSPGPYGFKKMIENFTQTYLVANLIDKDTTIDMSGVYLGFTANGYNYNDGITWLIKDGVKQSDYYTNNKPYLSFYPTNETTFNKIFNRYKIQIELSNTTTPSSYEPYTGGTASPNPDYPQEITNVTGDVEVKVQNKNLFDKQNATSKSGYIKDDNGNEISNGEFSYTTSYIKVNPNTTYTLSGKLVNNNRTARTYYYDKNKNWISRSAGFGANVNVCTFTTPQNCEYIQFQYINDAFDINTIQIEKNSTSTPYTPHKEQTLPLTLGNIELCKIRDYQDYFYKASNKWYLHKEIEKVVYDGSETGSSRYWYVQDENTYSYQITDNTIHLKESKKGICNRFIINSSGASPYLYPILQTGTSYCRFVTYNITGTISTLEEWKRWLSSNNIVFYYPLATPTDTEITDTTLISQLEAINNAYSYDEITIITGSSDGNKPFFIVQAYKDLNKELNNKVDKVQGKELSSNDFTDTLKEKLEGLENYDDTEIKADIEKIQEENARLKATLFTTGEVTGQTITLNKTAEMEFVKPPLPMGNSEQNGEPRPDNEVPLTNVTGDVEVTISNENNTESKTLPVSLGNIELCKIGNYQDYIYKNEGNWYVHKNIIKIDLSTITSYIHTSGWRNPTSFVADNVFYHEYSGYTTVASLFCNRLIADTPARITGSVINAIGLGRNSSIYISVEGITTSNALITYFSQNPTYLYAPLATPTDTEITDTTLISQLEEISKTLSYQGQTNITSNTIALFSVEAYQSTKLILQNLDSRLTLVEG